MRRFALVLIASTASAEPIAGVVVDRATKQPVAGATITVGDQLAATGDDGAFAIDLPRAPTRSRSRRTG